MPKRLRSFLHQPPEVACLDHPGPQGLLVAGQGGSADAQTSRVGNLQNPHARKAQVILVNHRDPLSPDVESDRQGVQGDTP